VNALAWDPEGDGVLYLGGAFHAVENVSISAGLAVWSRRGGLQSFPGGGVQHSDGSATNTQVKALAYDTRSQVGSVCLLYTGRLLIFIFIFIFILVLLLESLVY
jgi:hypothetical protein